jgi:N-acetyl-gamma-glutamyl-phosphate reductase
MAFKVYVDGQEGTTGLRIHEYLARRSDVELLRIDPDKRKDAAERARLLNAADVAFLCLPDAASREAAAMVDNPRTCLIDASTAFRTDPTGCSACRNWRPVSASACARRKRIANPGCHASAFILLLRPLVDAGLVPPTLPVSALSITGYSGGGKKMIEQYEASPLEPALTSPRPYGLTLAHKHVPEMMAHTGLTARPILMPVVSNFYKGLAVSVPLHRSQLPATATPRRCRRPSSATMPASASCACSRCATPATLETASSTCRPATTPTFVDLFVFANDTQLLLMARLDNLGKGASGAAVQSMNVHLGVDEGWGL